MGYIPGMATREVTLKNIDATIAEAGIVLLDFWAAWCGPCRAFAPVFEAASEEHPDMVFGKVDTEAQRDLAAAFRIMSIPTLVVFRDGIAVYAQPGALNAEALDSLIQAVEGLDMDAVRAEIASNERADGGAA